MQPPDLSATEWKAFLEEAESVIDVLNEHIVRLEQEGPDAALLQEIFRAAHTLKGSSGMLGLEEMAGLTHAMEDLLDGLRRGSIAVTASVVDALLLALDALKALKDQLQGPESAPGIDTSDAVAALRAATVVADGSPDAAGDADETTALAALRQHEEARRRAAVLLDEGQPLWGLVARVDPESEWGAVRCLQLLNGLDEISEVLVSAPSRDQIEGGDGAQALRVVLSAADEATVRSVAGAVEDIVGIEIEAINRDGLHHEARSAGQSREPAGQAEIPTNGASPRVEGLQSTVRIEVGQLDSMMNMVGELVIDRTRLNQLSRELADRFGDDESVSALFETAQHVEKLVDELHDRMLQVRMLPVGLLFSRFPRLVRDLSRALDRPIRLELEGEETEIDRSIIDKIKDPLVHLIRNACDHGIESPEERVALGKPEQATLHLAARHDQGQIVISLTDDGRGIDAERVKTRAVERGLISAEAADRLSFAEAVDLIFAPGLSTASTTTEVSGRGVGMDIVRRDIESLNGHIEVETEPGTGTTFLLRLPLTLATFPGLLIGSGDTRYAIPLSYVRETLRPEPGQIQTISGRPALHLRTHDTVIPLVWLDSVLWPNRARWFREGAEPYVVVVRGSDNESERPLAVAVDRLIDQQDIVVKSLSNRLGRARGIAGASILGDGQVVLILDVPALIKSSQVELATRSSSAVYEGSAA